MFNYYICDNGINPVNSNYIKNGYSLNTIQEYTILPNDILLFNPNILYRFYSDSIVYFKIDPQYNEILSIENNIIYFYDNNRNTPLQIKNNTNQKIKIKSNTTLVHVGSCLNHPVVINKLNKGLVIPQILKASGNYLQIYLKKLQKMP